MKSKLFIHLEVKLLIEVPHIISDCLVDIDLN
jgi:hypothetical protein